MCHDNTYNKAATRRGGRVRIKTNATPLMSATAFTDALMVGSGLAPRPWQIFLSEV